MTGLDEKDKIIVKLIDTTGEDITLALPLWAGVPEAQQANALIGRNISTADRFDRPFGLPSLPISPDPEADAVSMSVAFPWNQLIGEGLLAYGFRAEATRLTVHLDECGDPKLKTEPRLLPALSRRKRHRHWRTQFTARLRASGVVHANLGRDHSFLHKSKTRRQKFIPLGGHDQIQRSHRRARTGTNRCDIFKWGKCDRKRRTALYR